ncbi:MAG: phosphatidylserine decarboxylase family protein [Verrucomicrobiales bacterium]|jgi:phosphatidylserine decarboxylase|nr:phosphatidylserine decarboxylase family protein [Verrucomicrobiales bacterium]
MDSLRVVVHWLFPALMIAAAVIYYLARRANANRAFGEAAPFLAALSIAAAACWCLPDLWMTLTFLPLALHLYVLYFFRDPFRLPPADRDAIVSAADGKVIFVDEVVEPAYSRQKMKRVAVFLSVFDVHVNRLPYDGTIKKITHQPGKFLDARVPDIDVQNEAMNWLVATDRGDMVIRQIAGLIARRIVAWAKEGDTLTVGERFGMIRFGSRTDVYLPLDCEVLVKPGERVKGGLTVIARWPRR